MVAQQSQPQIQSPTPSTQDDALKRNTDCVYFLASPLTCKKGNECEYRHSEYARVNPRDCWYWLNGNCLNPKCSFRHPPLDGLLGTPPATASAPSLPSIPLLQHTTLSATHAPYNSSKPAVPCIFFHKGLCLKGDRCAFLHGPLPNNGNKVVTQDRMNSQGTEIQSFKKSFGGIEQNTQERKISQGIVVKPVGDLEAKPAQKGETAPQRNFFELKKNVPPTSAGFEDEASRFKITSTPSVINESTVVRSSHLHQAYVPDDRSFHNGKDNDEFLRETSPGFDVLVADELRNSDYYHGDDEFGNARGQDDLGHSSDYSLAADIGRDRFHVPETNMWEQHTKPPAHLEKRTHHRSDSPNNAEVSDLRIHLSKRRKGNGLKSVVTHDYAVESHGEEHSYRNFSRKDSLQLPLNASSLSNRFRGRIKLPINGGDGHPERESDRGRIRSRLSSGRLPAPHQGWLQDRIIGRVQDGERRNLRDRPVGRELLGDRTNEFYAPKRLSELKNESSENREQRFLGKRKSLRDQQSDDDFQFEGPKPLSEILKEKKRGVGAGAASQSGSSSENKNREITHNSDHTSLTNTQNGALSETMENVKNREEGSKSHVTDAVGKNVDNIDATHGQSSEEGLIYDEAAEDQEYEGGDQRDDVEYDYDQVDEGDYEYEQIEEGENLEQEYMDEEEDGDDFAKKIGVILT
ncbi:hypothetical protein TanjilG_01184 [Lupinus angustifolius]|uniref:C3H1-type domain-containing protein n=1 Tax=Lupinus angustifolius TaxID=3871 RepID=A0A1J7HYQ2_LUPAN|nr:PREDICTED: zinc finger CCCH domain-containing protein 17-like [Lupinus angustifolius]OIW18095.1 hypothetical protein TanjilG_01184 [Lupinus angustifolius]